MTRLRSDSRGGTRTPAAVVSLVLLTVLTVLTVLTGCGGTGRDPGSTGPATQAASRGSELSGRVAVLGAASLTETFTELAEQFEAEHPDVDVALSFGGSSGLAQQILSGAPADVFAAASPETMQTVVDAGATADEPVVFARNELQLVVPAGNPGDVRTLADLADPRRTVALCAEQVPCGAASARIFAATGITPAPDTLEQDVKAVLTKVTLGEADAGLVYRTDVRAAGAAVEGIDLPSADEAVNDYPIAVLADAPNADAARAFVDLVRSADGMDVLVEAGFVEP